MKSYILGAVTGGIEDAEETFTTYKRALKDKVEILGTPLETAKFKGTMQERFERAKQAIQQADVVIAEMSTASTGAGIELGMSYFLGKEIYCFAKEGSKVSGLIIGMVGEKNVIYYNSLKDLTVKLNSLEFKKVKQNEI